MLAERFLTGAQMPHQLVGCGHDVHRGTAPGTAPQDLAAAERNAELAGLGLEDPLCCLPQRGSFKFGCVHGDPGVHAADGNSGC